MATRPWRRSLTSSHAAYKSGDLGCFLTCVPESSSVDVDPNKSLSSPSPRSPIPACSGAKEDRPAKNLPPYFKSLSPPLALPERNSCAAPFCCMSIPAARGARPLCELLEDAAAPLSKGIRDGIGDIKADAWHTARARSAVLSISADPRARASGVAQQLAQPCPSSKRPLQAWISPDTPGTSRHSRSSQYLGDPCQWLGLPPPFAPNQPHKTPTTTPNQPRMAGDQQLQYEDLSVDLPITPKGLVLCCDGTAGEALLAHHEIKAWEGDGTASEEALAEACFAASSTPTFSSLISLGSSSLQWLLLPTI